ncbi:MAG: hypothetical protein C0402_10240 [Thermodesulfovibrio sp.]|nr:hypothetical protein [Thermodesulfovibrio sp.]
MVTTDINILMEFLNLPLGRTDEVFNKFAEIPGAIHRGSGLEQFIYIKGKRENRVLLVAHADTYWDKSYWDTDAPPQTLVGDGIIRNEHGGLGADDRAGCAMIWLLKDMGHSILITNGEERGRHGSSWLMDDNLDIANDINDSHQFMIQFDRRGATDFKCYTVGTDDFREYISRVTGYSEPDRMSYTDIVSLCRKITGVNLSIGYYDEHDENEHLIVAEWQNTLDVCRRWLSDEDLPRFNLKNLSEG